MFDSHLHNTKSMYISDKSAQLRISHVKRHLSKYF